MKYICWSLLVAVLFGFVWVFSCEEVTTSCSDSLIVCLENVAQRVGLWDKMSGVIQCVSHNVVCVVSNIEKGF